MHRALTETGGGYCVHVRMTATPQIGQKCWPPVTERQLVDVFERHGTTFVSVTQSFCTSSSMGRLTLNVLLSFAQFEREVAAERIRDKFAASRRRGMWMGGHVAVGFDIRDRKLVINQAEAALVRHIFQRFLRVGSATQSWCRS
jgi:site-specific DNA recombinase